MSDVVSCLYAWSKPDRSAAGLLGGGQRLARELGGKHVVVILGKPSDALGSAAAEAADSVRVGDDPLLATYHSETTLEALTQACRSLQPHTVLLGNDTYSQELTARLAHRLTGSAAGDAMSLRIDNRATLVTRPVYGGKAQATIALRRQPGVVWIRARAQAPAAPQDHRAEITPLPLSLKADGRLKVLNQQEQAKDVARLEDARFIVSGGRGLGGPEPFTQLQELAKAVGAQMAASRAACDAGWVPAGWQVGQTGKKVAPQLYLAIAISGASQHLMGIADAKVVAAINTDPEAPIFNRCQFGLVEDYREVVGPLREALAGLLR